MRPTVALTLGVAMGVALVAAPAQAQGPQGIDSVTTSLPGQEVLRAEDGRLLVYVEGDRPDALSKAVTASGGTVETTGYGRIRAAVADDKVDDIARQPGVREVRLPDRAIPMAVTSQGVPVSKADRWHADGHKGAGVKIGVIDVGFGGLLEAQQKGEVPTVTENHGQCANPRASNHGTNVVEIIHDMAPGAALFLACVSDSEGFRNAAEWLRQQNVQIISASIGFFGGDDCCRGDGSGPPGSPADVVKRSRQSGILWSVAAGNQAQSHFQGTSADADGDKWVEYDATTENNGFVAPSGRSTTVTLRWDAWPKTNDDLDLYVTRANRPPKVGEVDPNVIVRGDRDQQTVAGGPAESVTFTGTDALVYIWVRNKNVPFTTRLDLFVSDTNTRLQYFSRPGSIVEPATSPSVLAVGAVAALGGELNTKSSQGPTIDGRTKPDLAGYDRVTTSTSPDGFAGTSAAAAHVAGAAAVLKSANPAFDAAQLETELRNRAEADDVNNQTGHGKLSLGVPGGQPVAQSSGFTALSVPRRIHNERHLEGAVYTQLIADVPADATAVALNVTARSDAETRVDVFPSRRDQTSTKATTLEVRPGGGFTAVMTMTALGEDQAVKIRNHTGTTYVVIDLLGYFSKGSSEGYVAHPAPQRLLQPTRFQQDGETRDLPVRDVAGVPSTATAVLVNLTASESTDETWISAYSKDLAGTSTLNLRRNDRRSNLAIAAVSSEGNIRLRNERGQVTVAADVVGWFGTVGGARYVPLTSPVRIVNTANGTGVPAAPIGAGSNVSFAIKGLSGVSSDATAAVLNVTGTQDRTGTDLSVFAVEQGRTSLPSLPIGQRQNIAGAVLAPLGDSGTLALRNERGNAHAMVDLHGYFVGGAKVGAGTCALPGDPGFRSIFDGRAGTGLEAWASVGGSSTVDGCALVVAGGSGLTWYSGHTTSNDFTLELDWQAGSATSDSGVYLGFDQPTLPIPTGLEVQIGRPGATGDLATGAIVGRQAPAVTSLVRPVGEWNTLEITRSGPRIKVVLNGQQINDHTAPEVPPQTFIGLQHGQSGDPVRFRDIRIRDNATTGVGQIKGDNNKCLDVAGGKPQDHKLIAYTCGQLTHRAQIWTLPGDGSIRAYNKCLDVVHGSKAAGTPVQLYDCLPWDAQRWTVRPDGTIFNPRSGKCLTASGSADEATFTIEGCGAVRQVWRPDFQPATTGSFTLWDNKCLDVKDANPFGDTVMLYECWGGAAQQWSLAADRTVRAYGKCLDVAGGATAAGTKAAFKDCDGSRTQHWIHNPDSTLVNTTAERCLTAASRDDGAELTIQDCTDSPAQRWRASAQALSVGQLTSTVFRESQAKCLDVLFGDPSRMKVVMIQCSGELPQQWTVPGDGTIRAYGQCLDVKDGGTEDGTEVRIHPCNDHNAQQWVFRPSGEIVNPQSGRCLDATPNGMMLYACHGGVNQRWTIGGVTA